MPEIQSIAGALFGLSFSAWVLLELEDMQFTSTESEYVFLHSKILHAYAYVNTVQSTMSCVLLSLFKTSVLSSCSLNLLYMVIVNVLELLWCRDTWTQRSGQSWRSTCPWTIKEKFPIMSPVAISETEKGRHSYDATPLREKGRHSTTFSNQDHVLPLGSKN